MRVRTGAWLVAIALASGVAGAEQSPSIEALRDRLPHVDTGNPACPAFRIVARIAWLGRPFDLILSHDSAKRRAMRITDAEGTVSLVTVDDEFLMYDPVAPTVLSSSGGATTFEVVTKPGHIRFDLGLRTRPENSSRMVVDLRQVLSGTITREDDEAEIRIRAVTEKGNVATARFDAATPHRLKSLVFGGDKGQSVACVVQFEIDPEFHEAEFRFPKRKVLEQRLPVHEIGNKDDPSLTDVAFGFAAMSRTILVRGGIDSEEVRKSLPLAIVLAIDWEKTRKNDLRHTPVLRELFPPILPSRAQLADVTSSDARLR